MKNLAFTIVARNYIPLANILGNSLINLHSDIDFKIIIADNLDKNFDHTTSKFDLINADILKISDFEIWSFKYNLTEFCTSLKPFCFDLFLSSGYDNVIYFDPDIYIFSKLDHVINRLDHCSILLTPHIVFPETDYTGYWDEAGFMVTGIYNLGFLGVKKSEVTLSFIDWWKVRVADKCFIEIADGYFTDQKLVDFVPALFTEVEIDRHLGLNLALWNVHERRINLIDNKYVVSKRNGSNEDLFPLIFMHYSNFKFTKCKNDYSDFLPFNIDKYNDLKELVEFYSSSLAKSNFLETVSNNPYRFNYFSNGIEISKLNRRIFRKLIESGIKLSHPFNSELKNGFYSQLKNNGLITETTVSENINNTNISSFYNKLYLINVIFRTIKKIIGIRNYTYLCRFFIWYFRYEHQVFLIKKYSKTFPVRKEKSYINQ